MDSRSQCLRRRRRCSMEIKGIVLLDETLPGARIIVRELRRLLFFSTDYTGLPAFRAR